MMDRFGWASIGARVRQRLRRACGGLAALRRGAVRGLGRGGAALAQGTCRAAEDPPGDWRGLVARHRHLVANLIVGLLIALGLHLLHHSPLLHPFDEAAIDWTMRMFRGTTPARGTRPVAFIDIDEASYQRWGEPLITPRERLATLVRHAIAGGAAIIVLDVELSRPGGEGDQALLEVLRAYLPDAEGKPPPLPPLILTRGFRLPSPGAGPPGTKGLPIERATPFDEVAADAPGICWGAPLFDLDADGKVRRWRLWTAACGADGIPLVRPSVQLLAAATLDGTEVERAGLTDALWSQLPVDCSGAELWQGQAEGAGKGEVLTLGGRSIRLRPQATETRVVYRTPWHPAENEVRPTVALDGTRVPVLAVRPAHVVADTADPQAAAWLRGHTVIIGASHQDARDLYITPIGQMPGALILANAVQSLGHHGELSTPGLAGTLALEAFLIAVMSWLFARFDSFVGGVLSGLVVVLLLLPFSLWTFNTGVWLSFAIPLLAVVAHKSIAEIEASFAAVKSQGQHHD